MDLCSKNASLHKRRHQFRIVFYSVFCLSDTFLGIAVQMHFRFEKPTKNPSKTRSDTSKNRCWKHFVFQYHFCYVLGSILESLGPPRSAALLAAPGVLDPTAFFTCIHILLCLLRGGQNFQILDQMASCWHYVGIMLPHFLHSCCMCAKIALIGGNHRKNQVLMH